MAPKTRRLSARRSVMRCPNCSRAIRMQTSSIWSQTSAPYAIERFAATDVYRRFDLDLGKALRDKAPSAVTALSRLKQVKDYVKETVAAAFRRMRDAGRVVTAGRVNQIVRDALRDTFEVFEGYSE